MTTTLKSIVGKTTLAPADGGPKLVLQSAVFGPRGVSITNVVVRDDEHLIVSLSNGNQIDAGVTYTNPMLPKLPWIIGAKFDGAGTSAYPPTLSNNSRTATWSLGSVESSPAQLSARTYASGQRFIAVQINIAGTVGLVACAGFCNSSFDPNNVSGTLAGNVAATAATTNGTDLDFGADIAVLGVDTLVTGSVIMTGVDLDNSTWLARSRDGTDYPNAQNEMGVGGHLLGMPSGALSPFILIDGSADTTATVAITMLKDADLAELGLTGPAGYTNVCG